MATVATIEIIMTLKPKWHVMLKAIRLFAR